MKNLLVFSDSHQADGFKWGVDVINSIFLTDGDSHSSSGYWNTEGKISNFDIRED